MAFWAAVLLTILGSQSHATGLPPEHEANRLMLAIEQSVNAGEWQKADAQMQALQALSRPLPEAFHFFAGRVNQALGSYEEAQANFETYVIEAGQEGNYYQQALLNITRIEELVLQQQEAEPVSEKAEIAPAQEGRSDGYIKSLQALYLTDDPKKALLMQANSLLAAHAYTGSRVKSTERRSGVVYSLAIEGQDLMVQEKAYRDGQPTLKMVRFKVLGLDPFIRTGCSNDEYACWVYHPADKFERWLVIDRDEMVVQELSEALSKLILLMQRSG